MTTIGRTQHTRVCQTCEGAGETIVNTTNPHGYGPDPQCDEPESCATCIGTGVETLWTDPLVRLHRCRQEWPRLFPRYAVARRDATRRVRLPVYVPPAAELRYIERLRKSDPVAAKVLGPMFDQFFGVAA